MEARKFGRAEWELHPVGMGCMPLSLKEDRPEEKEAVRVILRAVECGVQLFDTADAYYAQGDEPGHNERIVGKALRELSDADRERLVVATKGGHVRPEGRWETDGRPEHLREVCEASLENLRMERIPLYQFHRPDPNTPIEDSLGELKRLQDEGKILHIGVSNFSMEQIERAEKVVTVVSLQNRFGPASREVEADGTHAIALARNIAFMAYGPLNGMNGAKALGEGDETVREIAARHEASPQRLALAWLLSKGPNLFPIPGASRPESVEDSAKAAEIRLSLEEVQALNQTWRLSETGLEGAL